MKVKKHNHNWRYIGIVTKEWAKYTTNFHYYWCTICGALKIEGKNGDWKEIEHPKLHGGKVRDYWMEESC